MARLRDFFAGMKAQPEDPTSQAFFEEKYRGGADPWNFAKNPYELSRYDAIVRELRGVDGTRRYRHAFEPGCSVGVLSVLLAEFCDAVESVDLAPSAIATAQRERGRDNIVYRAASLPERLPLLGFDLLVLSEIGYYFTPKVWTSLVRSMVATAAPGTAVLAAHWLGTSKDHCMHGDEVHAILRAEQKLHLLHEEQHAGFRLDRWERRA